MVMPITDDERLHVIYILMTTQENSYENISKMTGISKNRVEGIIRDHFIKKYPVKYIVLESQMNNK